MKQRKMSDVQQPLLTNVTIQTFASDADRALHDERWTRIEEDIMARLRENGLVSFKSMKVWNKDSDLVMLHIFEYRSPDALKSCLPIWKEVEAVLFTGVAVKTVAYRGVVTDLWHADGA